MSEAARAVVLSHPGIPPNTLQAARALYEAGLLRAYVTTVAYQPETLLGRVLKHGLRPLSADPERQLRRRSITELPADAVIAHPTLEILRMGVVKLGNPILADLVWEQAELWFDRRVARLHVPTAAASYAYEHAALYTFQAQKSQGGSCIYEMPIAHHVTTDALLEPEFDRFPAVRTAYEEHRRRHAPRRNARKDAELVLADLVVTPTNFSRDSLVTAGVPPDSIAVVPYGAPAIVATSELPRSDRVIFLSAGSQSVRKGTHYLLEAWRLLRPGRGVELWLVGSITLPDHLLADLPGTVVIKPSIPRTELFELYGQATALVFPSLCEGFGLVITEALSHGLPVITTPNTAGPNLIEDGANGFLVPIRDAYRLAEAMQWCIDHPSQLEVMRRRALETAAYWQWDDYRSALASVVSRHLRAGSLSSV
jgi:glycosyltransferase involved in cell wall biosynthesis